MKNTISLRNMLILLAAVIIALLALGFVSTLLNQIIPITIALIVGIVLGRLSINVNLIESLRSALRRPAQSKAAPSQQAAEQAPAEAPAEVQVRTRAEAIKARLADQEPQAEEKAEITDFTIKTEEEVLAEARRLEEEAAKRAAAYDPAEALAERRRRLLGDQADKS